jgi:hypothetical protein
MRAIKSTVEERILGPDLLWEEEIECEKNQIGWSDGTDQKMMKIELHTHAAATNEKKGSDPGTVQPKHQAKWV